MALHKDMYTQTRTDTPKCTHAPARQFNPTLLHMHNYINAVNNLNTKTNTNAIMYTSCYTNTNADADDNDYDYANANNIFIQNLKPLILILKLIPMSMLRITPKSTADTV